MRRRFLIIIAAILLIVSGIIWFVMTNNEDYVPHNEVSAHYDFNETDTEDEEEEDPYSAEEDVDLNTPQVLSRVEIPQALRELTYANRSLAFPEPLADLDELLNDFFTPNLTAETDIALAERIMQYRQDDRPAPSELTHDEIVYEIDFLFELLRYGYAAYQYFGGDEVFLPLRESMLAQLAEMPNPLSTQLYVNSLLVPSLMDVIADNHVSIHHHTIGTHPIGVRSQFYLNSFLIVQRTESGFVTEIGDVLYKILEVINQDGREIEAIYPTLTREGEAAYAFGYVSYGHRSGTITPQMIQIHVLLENTENSATHIRTINLAQVPNANVSHENAFSTKEIDGIMILENRRLWQQQENDPPLQNFVSTALPLRNEPVLVLDLRGNAGGNDGYAAQWVQLYTGRAPVFSIDFRHLRLNSMTTNAISPWIPQASPPEWNVWGSNLIVGNRYIDNENLLIVLTDNAIGSSGDSFVSYLRQLTNMLIVGTNTQGVLVTGNVGSVSLPSSKAFIGFGTTLNIRPDLSQFEGVGFMPDLWVPPNESLERVLKFIERYSIYQSIYEEE